MNLVIPQKYSVVTALRRIARPLIDSSHQNHVLVILLSLNKQERQYFNAKVKTKKSLVHVQVPLTLNSHNEWSGVRGLREANLRFTNSLHCRNQTNSSGHSTDEVEMAPLYRPTTNGRRPPNPLQNSLKTKIVQEDKAHTESRPQRSTRHRTECSCTLVTLPNTYISQCPAWMRVAAFAQPKIVLHRGSKVTYQKRGVL